MSGRVHDRVVVVTGAAGGQGAAEVAALRTEGAIVVATDIQAFAGEEPDGIHRRHLDITSPEDWETLAGWAKDRFGRVDGLINNAGIPSRARLEEVAALMVFLMSDECPFLTGADIPVDGGLSSGGVAKSLSDALRR
jgi:NAD(P)-dependent dehydrogenase (short-subunit alcohol dehydrogenase family)